ncbi:uncharacterized protein zgc:174945 [Labrus mixtus]|uniref:uncharacterized protein zgc:174945 n=1 Tax=Labrus mixtus TaxID=508554 RepID=UPI0029C0EEFE|nr:uncharacterized protein zgc:174945 [Labrus mixtus]
MTWFAGSVLLLVILCVSTAVDKVTLELRYQRATLTPSRGSSVKLSCNAVYNSKLCGLLHVVWCQDSTELTEPRKYFTTVNETISGRDMRRRQVVTEILDLTSKDSGRYQCTAKCAKSQEAAVGVTITIDVKE